MNLFRTLTVPSLLASSALVSLSSLAFAQPASECAADSDCDMGFVCQTTAMSSCAAPACAPDQECDPAPTCEPAEYKSCVPGPCDSDADCADGMACAEVPTACDAPAIAPGQDAGPVTETCESTTAGQCTPKYVLPCETAVDCGEGFECQARELCACAGGGATPTEPQPGEVAPPVAVDGGTAMNIVAPAPSGDPSVGADPIPPDNMGAAPAPTDAACTCTTVSECVMKELDCTQASDCPSGWSCDAVSTSVCGGTVDPSNPTTTTPDAPASNGEPATGALPAPPAQDAGPAPVAPPPTSDVSSERPVPTSGDVCPPPEVKYQCMPPYGGTIRPPTSGGSGTGEGGGTPVVSDPGTPSDPGVPGDAGTGVVPQPESSTTDSNGDPTPPTGPAASGESNAGGGKNPVSEAATSDDGGCSVAQTGRTAPRNAAWLVLAGLGALFFRRRDQRA